MTFDEGKINRDDDGKFGVKTHQSAGDVDLNAGPPQDWADEDFTEPGFYAYTHGGEHADGPFETLEQMVETLEMDEYPRSGGIVHYDGDVIGAVPSMNPDLFDSGHPASGQVYEDEINKAISQLVSDYGGKLSSDDLAELSSTVAKAIENGKLAEAPHWSDSTKEPYTIDDVAEATSTDCDDATRELLSEQSGLSDWEIDQKKVYWDSYSTPDDSLGFTASGTFDAVDTDYLSPEGAAAIKSLTPVEQNRGVHFNSHGRDSTTGASQYVSVDLTEDERNEVVAFLNERDGDDFHDDQVAYWADGSPGGMDRTFGFSSNRKAWDNISDAVRQVHPEKAGRTLDVAENFRKDLGRQHQKEMEHIGSDEWKEGILEGLNVDRA